MPKCQKILFVVYVIAAAALLAHSNPSEEERKKAKEKWRQSFKQLLISLNTPVNNQESMHVVHVPAMINHYDFVITFLNANELDESALQFVENTEFLKSFSSEYEKNKTPLNEQRFLLLQQLLNCGALSDEILATIATGYGSIEFFSQLVNSVLCMPRPLKLGHRIKRRRFLTHRLLRAAIDTDNIRLVRALVDPVQNLRMGEELYLAINAYNRTRNTHAPLHRAIQRGQLAIVNTLIKSGASPQLVNKKDQTPLQLAQDLLNITQLPIFEKIIASIELACCASLFKAIENEQLRTVLFLVQNGTRLDLLNEGGQTPLQLAQQRSKDKKSVIRNAILTAIKNGLRAREDQELMGLNVEPIATNDDWMERYTNAYDAEGNRRHWNPVFVGLITANNNHNIPDDSDEETDHQSQQKSKSPFSMSRKVKRIFQSIRPMAPNPAPAFNNNNETAA